MNDTSFILAIDTHHLGGSIAIGSQEQILGLLSVQTKLSHTQRLLASIEFLLEQLQLSLHQCSVIAINKGPGSFTGLRIGLSTVKGLALPMKITMTTFDTNLLLAYGYRGRHTFIASLVDAGRNEVYFRLYEKRERSLKPLSEYHVLSPKNIIQFTGNELSRIVLIGSGAIKYRDTLSALGFKHIEEGEAMLAKTMLEMIFEGKGEKVSIEAVDALYVRRPDAELK